MVLSRREILLGGLAALTVAATGERRGCRLADVEEAQVAGRSWFAGTAVDNGVTFRKTNFAKVDKKWQRQIVKYYSTEPVGTVVVDTRTISFTSSWRTRRRSATASASAGKGSNGMATRPSTATPLWPRWVPPPRCSSGSPNCRLHRGRRAGQSARPARDVSASQRRRPGYRLHGTLEPWSIGTDASSGCIRMFPEDVIDLYQRCPIGTYVQVLPHIADQADKANQLPTIDHVQ